MLLKIDEPVNAFEHKIMSWSTQHLHRVARKFAWLCKEVHSVAMCTPINVNYGGSCIPVKDVFNSTTSECTFPNSFAYDDLSDAHAYYNSSDWSYQIGCYPYSPNDGHFDMIIRLEYVIPELRHLKLQVQRNSIMMNLVSHLLIEVTFLLEWLQSHSLPGVQEIVA